MNRKEKGFTLVEIIGVIVLMGLVITIGSTTINNIKNVSREKLYNEQINRLVSVSKTWAIENTNKMPSTIGDTYQVGIDRLVEEGYLKSNEIIDVRDNSKITGCVEIAYNSVNSYDYSYVTKDSCYDYDTVYTITYDLDGGVLENSNPTSYRNSTPTFLINNPTKAGYSFTGWEDISNPGIYNMLLKIKIGSKGNKYFKAIWTLDVNIVTIDPNGGLYENSSDIKNVEVLSFSSLDISVPTRNGYVFNGWTVEGYATLEGNTLSINKENVTLTANWRKISALTLNLNGGTSSQGLSHQLVEGASINLTTPTRTGYTFSGWEVLGTSEKITNGKYTMGSNDTIVMALWTPITYTLTVNPNGGTLNGSTANRTYSMQYGETRGIANPTRDGYIFGGWTVSGTESSMNGTVFQMGTANATITAKWKSLKPSYTYTGESQLIDDGDGNWRIKFITSGTLTFNDLGNGSSGVDIFLVGGGGGGGSTRTQTIRGSFGKHSNSWGTYDGAYINRNDGGGGGGGYTYHTIRAISGLNGSISPSGWTSVRHGWDQTFTITPDKGYAVAKVLVDGKSVGSVKSYTFKNVAKDHTIEVVFMKANGNPQTGVFVDVAEGSYYEEAVDWAVKNGITTGTGNNYFTPDGICTRAQAVTFLWRVAGSPTPKTEAMPFEDVLNGSYYYEAVLWAVENGITVGTSATTFSPELTCSRAHIVTFLWRAANSPSAKTANPFTDVAADAYYIDAVLWAVKHKITVGTTLSTFSPDEGCTRAQIVTFLYRAHSK